MSSLMASIRSSAKKKRREKERERRERREVRSDRRIANGRRRNRTDRCEIPLASDEPEDCNLHFLAIEISRVLVEDVDFLGGVRDVQSLTGTKEAEKRKRKEKEKTDCSFLDIFVERVPAQAHHHLVDFTMHLRPAVVDPRLHRGVDLVHLGFRQVC